MVLHALSFKCQTCEREIGVYSGDHVREGHNLKERWLRFSFVPINSTFETMVVSVFLKTRQLLLMYSLKKFSLLASRQNFWGKKS